MSTLRQSAIRWLQRGLTLLFVVLLLTLLELGEVGRLLRAAEPRGILLALAVSIFDRILMIAKWYPLLAVQAPAVPFARAARAYLAANFTNYFLPSTVGSDALRAAVVGRPHGLGMEVGASIVIERLFGMFANSLLIAVSVAVAFRLAASVSLSAPFAVLLFLGATAAVMAPFIASVRELVRRIVPFHLFGRHEALLRRFASAYVAYRHRPGLLTMVGLVTLAEVLVPLVVYSALSAALGVDVPFAVLLVAVPLSQVVGKLPISIAGVGPQEATLVSTLALLGVSAETGLALAILNRLLDVLVALPGAFLWRDLADALRRPPGGAAA